MPVWVRLGRTGRESEMRGRRWRREKRAGSTASIKYGRSKLRFLCSFYVLRRTFLVYTRKTDLRPFSEFPIKTPAHCPDYEPA